MNSIQLGITGVNELSVEWDISVFVPESAHKVELFSAQMLFVAGGLTCSTLGLPSPS